MVPLTESALCHSNMMGVTLTNPPDRLQSAPSIKPEPLFPSFEVYILQTFFTRVRTQRNTLARVPLTAPVTASVHPALRVPSGNGLCLRCPCQLRAASKSESSKLAQRSHLHQMRLRMPRDHTERNTHTQAEEHALLLGIHWQLRESATCGSQAR